MDDERIDWSADDAPPPPPPPPNDVAEHSEPDPEPAPEPDPAESNAHTEPDSNTDPEPAPGDTAESATEHVDAPTDAQTALLAESAPEPTAALPEPALDAAPTAVVPNIPTFEPPTVDEQEPERRYGMRRGTKVGIGVFAFLLVLGGAYAGTAFYIQDKIPNNTFVDDVAIGGLTADEATAKVAAAFADLPEEPVAIVAGENSTELTGADLGLSIDAAGTVDPLIGVSFNPSDLWNHFTGLGRIEPLTAIDIDTAQAGIASVLSMLEVEPVEGAITLDGAEAVVTDAVDAVRVDIPASIETIKNEWRTTDSIELTTVLKEPDISQADVDAAMKNIVEPLLSGPVEVTSGDASAKLSPEDLASASQIVPENGSLALTMDAEALHALLTEDDNVFEESGKNAQIVIKNGAPTIIPSTTGKAIDTEQLGAAVSAAAVSTESREAVIELVEADPEFSTKDAEALGVKEEVSIFSTPLTSDNVRTMNLIAGSKHVTNTLVKPGETFSLLAQLTPITAANGYVSSGVVENGFTSEAMGGGLSQVSATTYNAAYFAGMDLIEHKPHSRWFARYPEGRESTVWDSSVDMKFRNSTPYGVLVEAWVADGKQWVRMWSTKYYEVETYTSNRYAIVQPGVKYNSDPKCIAESGGQYGFTVDGWRKRYIDGKLDETYPWVWTYQPWNEVRCGTEP